MFVSKTFTENEFAPRVVKSFDCILTSDDIAGVSHLLDQYHSIFDKIKEKLNVNEYIKVEGSINFKVYKTK